jgi:CRISPR/Cas system CSM-associated protein Csm3 (group 7 of RAMP superfamily)
MERTHKFLAHLIIEADTPLAVGSGEKGFTVDRLIARDALGLPYIPGTSIAGVLRHALAMDNDQENTIFGYQYKDTGQGSRIIFSDAQLISDDGVTAIEGLQVLDTSNPLISLMQKLPERDHVRISHKGTVDGSGKFDEQVVYKGTRFAFRMEFQGVAADEDSWNTLLAGLRQPFFRLGGGTRKGFGKLKFIRVKQRTFNLTKKQDLKAYIDTDSSLNIDTTHWMDITEEKHTINNSWTHYKLHLTPKDFVLFGAGYGDDDADSKPKTEQVIEWTPNGDTWTMSCREHYLVPATSIKGPLAHRTAYHYNCTNQFTVESIQIEAPTLVEAELLAEMQAKLPDFIDESIPYQSEKWNDYQNQIDGFNAEEFLTNSDVWRKYQQDLDEYHSYTANFSQLLNKQRNEAVEQLFGLALETQEQTGARGNVIIDDVYLRMDSALEKIFSHVSIDRFTGAARDAMLFQQKVVRTDSFELDIYVQLENNAILTHFENALTDLVEGRLPLGGSTTKGHGRFSGTYEKNIPQ